MQHSELWGKFLDIHTSIHTNALAPIIIYILLCAACFHYLSEAIANKKCQMLLLLIDLISQTKNWSVVIVLCLPYPGQTLLKYKVDGWEERLCVVVLGQLPKPRIVNTIGFAGVGAIIESL